MRLGRIPWINCYPVYGRHRPRPRAGRRRPGDRHRRGAQRPAGGRRARRERGLGGRVRPRTPRRTTCCPTSPSAATARCTACALFSQAAGRASSTGPPCSAPRRPARRCCCSSCCAGTAGRWRRSSPRSRAEPADLDALARLPARRGAGHRRRGAACWPRGAPIRAVLDLGAAWKEWTGLPFVFAVWAARRDAPTGARARRSTRALLASRAWGLAHLDLLADQACGRHRDRRGQACRAYLGDLDYALSLPAPRGADRLLPPPRAGRAGAGRARSAFITAA